MASILYSTFEVYPADTGYLVQHDHYNDGRNVETVIPVAGAPAAAANFASLITKAQAALTNNQTFLAIGAPTTAQAVTQVQALTKQTDALIYYLLHALTGLANVNGT